MATHKTTGKGRRESGGEGGDQHLPSPIWKRKQCRDSNLPPLLLLFRSSLCIPPTHIPFPVLFTLFFRTLFFLSPHLAAFFCRRSHEEKLKTHFSLPPSASPLHLGGCLSLLPSPPLPSAAAPPLPANFTNGYRPIRKSFHGPFPLPSLPLSLLSDFPLALPLPLLPSLSRRYSQQQHQPQMRIQAGMDEMEWIG